MSINVCNDRSMASITSLPSGVVGGSLILLSTQTASSSATINFTSGIDSTYKEYQFHFTSIHPGTDDADTLILGSIDSGSNYNVAITSSFVQAVAPESGGSPSVDYLTSKDVAQGTSGAAIEHSVGADNDQSSSGILHLFNPASTTFVKHFISRMHISHAVNNAQDMLVAGYFNTASAIDAIQFKKNTGNIDSGIIKMYGVV